MTNTDDFLEHFGVKGMKWGKRKTPEERRAFENEHPNRLGLAYAKSAFTGKIGDYSLTPYQRFSRASTTVYAGIAAAGATYVVAKYGPATINTVKLVNAAAKSHEAAQGAKMADRMLGDLGKNLPYSKIIGGAYKVTTLK